MQLSEILEYLRVDLTLLTCLVLSALLVRVYKSRRKNFPPGPYCLPIVGYLPLFFKKPHVALMDLGQKYGDVFSVQGGSETFVILNSGEAAREILSKPELLDRPEQSRFLIAPSKDPFFGNGQAWREHKKFALRVFRELNANKAMEEKMKIEIKKFLDFLRSSDGKPIDARQNAFSTVIDIATAINCCKPLDKNDPLKPLMDKYIMDVTEMVETSMIFIFFPWMRDNKLLRKILKMDKLLKTYNEAMSRLRTEFEERKKLRAEISDTTLSTYYVDEMAKPDCDKKTFTDKVVIDGISALFGAGTETVKDSLIWVLYTMAVYQDVQTKVHKEIDDVLGKDTMPSYSDQKEMRYTQAVLMEILRWQTIVPLGIRNVSVDVNMRGYNVPKDTMVLINIYGIHHDPRCWKDPEDFIPERFLSPDGKHILKNDNYMPFSYGKRSCVGEGIALMELFLFFACIMQKFKVELPKGDKINFDGFGAISYQMKHHRLRFLPRD